MGLVVLVHRFEKVRVISQRLQQAASVRVPSQGENPSETWGKGLDLDATIDSVGIAPLERVDVGSDF